MNVFTAAFRNVSSLAAPAFMKAGSWWCVERPVLRLEVVPCAARWDAMAGDSDKRHCSDCERDVHDLSMRTEPEALALLERGACVRYRTDERGAVRLAAQSFCVAAVTLGACTPTGRDEAGDVLAVEPVDEIDVGVLVDHDLPGVEHIERLSREITVQGHLGCEDGGCAMGGIPVPQSTSITVGVPAGFVVVIDGPRVLRTDPPRSKPSKAEPSARAAKRALRLDQRNRKRLHRAAHRADRKARRATRRFARARRFVAKLERRSLARSRILPRAQR